MADLSVMIGTELSEGILWASLPDLQNHLKYLQNLSGMIGTHLLEHIFPPSLPDLRNHKIATTKISAMQAISQIHF